MVDARVTTKTTLALVDDPLLSEHRPHGAHPECPERLTAARRALELAQLRSEKQALPMRDASDEELLRVHSQPYLDLLDQAAGRSGYLERDTYFAPHSVAAARRAAGGAVSLVDALSQGASFGVGLLRPPGHHARPDGAMGFCLLNNVAVAAAHARANGVSRVAILDYDVHHGNGTQEMFYDDPSVLYLSVHRAPPFYPRTGSVDEVGDGDGTGFTINVPLSAGATDADYLEVFERIFAPVLEAFDPELLLLSAGFDAHAFDPLGGMCLSDELFGELTLRAAQGCPLGARGRVALLLEGGYHLGGLERSLSQAVRALDRAVVGAAPEAYFPARLEPRPRAREEIARAAERAGIFWRLG
jgi:acetoin utilization deacetylase AcuC-like enzyme